MFIFKNEMKFLNGLVMALLYSYLGASSKLYGVDKT